MMNPFPSFNMLTQDIAAVDHTHTDQSYSAAAALAYSNMMSLIKLR